MSTIELGKLPDFEPFPGYRGKLVHSATMTIAHWTIDADRSIPEHSHPHEQVVNMMEGEFELVVDGVPHRLTPGDVVVIPGDVPHAGRSITDCRIIDMWHPRRDDYQA